MQFRVRTADGTVKFDGSYEGEDNGVLKILPDESKPMLQGVQVPRRTPSPQSSPLGRVSETRPPDVVVKREIADLTSAIGMAAAGDSCRCWRVLLMS
jgi:hypothetical protein